MAEFKIGATTYKSGLFDGRKQVHVMRRLLPTFNALTAVAGDLGKIGIPRTLDSAAEEALDEEDRVAIEHQRSQAMAALSLKLAPVTERLASLSDTDVDFIIDSCLEVTERTLPDRDGWAPVVQKNGIRATLASGGIIQNPDDQRFANRLQIAWNVIGENFTDMFRNLGVDVQGLMSKAGVARN